MNRFYRVLFLFVSSGIILLLVVYLSVRNGLIQKKVEEKITSYNQHHDLKIGLGEVKMKGLFTVTIDSISLTTTTNDTLVKSA